MNKYELLEYTSIRYPTLPLKSYNIIENIPADKYTDYFSKEEISQIENGIHISSQNLYKSYKKNMNNSAKESLMKFYNRSITRPTPFGMFAGTALSKINITKDICVKIEVGHDDNFYFYLDFKWLYEFINIIETNTEIIPYLKVRINPLIINNNNYYYNLTKFKPNDSTIFKKNKLTDAIYNFCQKDVQFKDLFLYIKNISDDNIPQITIYNKLIQLINKSFLITELSMIPNDSYYLEYILNILQKIDAAYPYYSKLYNISILLKKLCQCNASEMHMYIDKIINKMQSLHKSNDYLCVIKNKTDCNLFIGNETKNNIIHMINLLSDIAEYCYENIEVEKYKNLFLEKYGTNREILLVDLINPHKGLGWPKYFFTKQETNYDNQNLLQLKALLLDILNESTKNEIDISNNKIFSFFENIKSKSKAVNNRSASFELDFISSNLSKKIYIAPSLGSIQIGKYAGRFTPAYSDKQIKYYEKLCKTLDDYYAIRNTDLYELKLPFMDKKMFNITINDYHNSNQFSPFQEKNDLDISNISVSLYNNDLIFKNIKTNKIIRFITYNALNSKVDNFLYRFLLDFSSEIVPLYGISCLYKEFASMRFSPRIKFKNIIIYPRMLKLYSSELSNISEIKNYIFKYLKNNYFYLKVSDNRLLLNLNDVYHMKYIYRYLKCNNQITVTEIEDDINYAIQNNGLINEFTLSFINNIDFNKYHSKTKFSNIHYSDRNKNIFSDWIYLKIYLHKGFENYFIKCILNSLMKNLIKKTYIDKFFYIRYIDTDDHIRFRIKTNKKNTTLAFLKKYLLPLLENYYIKNISIDSYERETERYGGSNAIDFAEEFFMYDSLYSSEIVNLDQETKEFYTIFLVISTLKYFGLNLDQSLKLFEFVNKNSNRKQYIKKRNSLKHFINNIEQNDIYKKNYKLYLRRNDSIKVFKNNCSQFDDEIILSCLHMMCNRIFGTNKKMEQKIYAFSRHYLYEYKSYYKYRNQ